MQQYSTEANYNLFIYQNTTQQQKGTNNKEVMLSKET